MKKILITSALAMVVAIGTSGTARAQLSYGYTIPAFGGVETVGGAFTSYGPQNFKDFYSPTTGYISETSGTIRTLWGNSTYTSIYSPFTGYMSENKGSTMTPFGTASYLSYYSPYTGRVGTTTLGNSSSSNSGLTNFNNIVPFDYYYHPWCYGNNWYNSGSHKSR
jgi:hypothetical protein